MIFKCDAQTMNNQLPSAAHQRLKGAPSRSKLSNRESHRLPPAARLGFSALVVMLFLASTLVHAATIIGPGSQVGNEDTQIGPLTVTVQNAANPNFSFDVFSSNTKLFPNSAIVRGGSGANRTITLVPAKDESGSATIIISVFDGVSGATATLMVTVNPANDAPTLDPISNVTITAAATITLQGITAGPTNENAQTLSIQASSSNPTSVPNPEIVYISPNTTGTLTLQPTPQGSGTANITVTVKDNGGGTDTTLRTFLVTVIPLNHAPIANAQSLAADEDTAKSGTLTGSDPDGDSLTFAK